MLDYSRILGEFYSSKDADVRLRASLELADDIWSTAETVSWPVPPPRWSGMHHEHIALKLEEGSDDWVVKQWRAHWLAVTTFESLTASIVQQFGFAMVVYQTAEKPHAALVYNYLLRKGFKLDGIPELTKLFSWSARVSRRYDLLSRKERLV